MFNLNKCIKPSKEINLTLNDCLACSGCISPSETSISFSSLPNLLENSSYSIYIISSFSKLNIYFSLNLQISFEMFETILFNFILSLNSIPLDTSSVQELILENISKEFFDKKKLIVSDCPATVKYVERKGSDFINFLSNCYSAHKVLELKFKMFKKVFIVQCLDKKLEKLDGIVVTTKEFKQFLDEKEFLEFIKSQINDFGDENDLKIKTNSDYIESCKFKLKNFESEELNWQELIKNPSLKIHKKILFPYFKSNFNRSNSGGYVEYLIKKIEKPFIFTEKTQDYCTFTNKDYTFLKIYGLKNVLNFLNEKPNFDFAEIFVCKKGCIGSLVRVNKDAGNEEMWILDQKEINNLQLNVNELSGRSFSADEFKKTMYNVEW